MLVSRVEVDSEKRSAKEKVSNPSRPRLPCPPVGRVATDRASWGLRSAFRYSHLFAERLNRDATEEARSAPPSVRSSSSSRVLHRGEGGWLLPP